MNLKEIRHNNYYYFTGTVDTTILCNEIGRLKINDNYEYYVEFANHSNEMLATFLSKKPNIIKPILITEPMLLNSGFEKQNFGYGFGKSMNYHDDRFQLFDNNYGEGKIDLVFNASHTPTPKIKYLHQLQNLFSDMMQKELKVIFSATVQQELKADF